MICNLKWKYHLRKTDAFRLMTSGKRYSIGTITLNMMLRPILYTP